MKHRIGTKFEDRLCRTWSFSNVLHISRHDREKTEVQILQTLFKQHKITSKVINLTHVQIEICRNFDFSQFFPQRQKSRQIAIFPNCVSFVSILFVHCGQIDEIQASKHGVFDSTCILSHVRQSYLASSEFSLHGSLVSVSRSPRVSPSAYENGRQLSASELLARSLQRGVCYFARLRVVDSVSRFPPVFPHIASGPLPRVCRVVNALEFEPTKLYHGHCLPLLPSLAILETKMIKER